MHYVIERTHVIDHERFLEAGPHARDLWEWGMKYSGKFELDGAIPMAAVLASPWGYGGKKNIVAAQRLVEVGLWERTERGYQIRKWSEQGNKTKAEIDASREKGRKKKASQRLSEPRPSGSPPPCPQGTPQGTPSGVLNSTSYSDSGSGSREGMQGETLRRDAPLADDARAVWDTVTMARPIPGHAVADVWLAFAGHNAGQPFANRESLLGRWQKWIGQQAKFAEQERQRGREREDRERFKRDGPPKPPPESPEQRAKFARELAAYVTGAKPLPKVGT